MDYLKFLSSRLSKVVAVRRKRPRRRRPRVSNSSLKLTANSNTDHQALGLSMSSTLADARVGCCADEASNADRSPSPGSRTHRRAGQQRRHEAKTEMKMKTKEGSLSVRRKRPSNKNVTQIMNGLDKLVQIHVARLEGQTAVASPTATQILQYVTLIDATGREHPISMQCCTSYEQLKTILSIALKGRSVGSLVQKRYFDAGQYDLCIDQGAQVVQMTDDADKWPTIGPGTKLVMRLVFHQKQRSCKAYQCCSCGASDRLDCLEAADWSGWLTDGSIDCQACGARFQISLEKNKKKESETAACDVPELDEETRACIRNFRVNTLKLKQVAFCEDDSNEIYEADEWDRSPVPAVQRLTYGDILEMKMLQRDLYQAPQPPSNSNRANVLLPRVPIPLLRLNP